MPGPSEAMLKITAIILITFASGCFAEVESAPPEQPDAGETCHSLVCGIGPIECETDEECGAGVCSDGGVCVAPEE